MIQYNQAKERHVEKVRTHRSQLRSESDGCACMCTIACVHVSMCGILFDGMCNV